MADSKEPREELVVEGPVNFAVPCAGGVCGKFAIVTVPMVSFDSMVTELASFGWFLSEGTSADLPGKLYSPLCPGCAQRITEEQQAERVSLKGPRASS